MAKPVLFKAFFPLLLLIILSGSCVSVREDTYLDTSYDNLVEKKGVPAYSINQTIGADYERSKFEPEFSDFFSAAELEESIVIKYATWKKAHWLLMIWLKSTGGDIDDEKTWIVFKSLEKRGPFLK